MADKLPKFMVIKPPFLSRYAYYETKVGRGYVYCLEESVFSPFTKIEVEVAKNSGKYVHLRFCHSNKYWARQVNAKWVLSDSNQPEEDTSKLSCTLFEPTVGDDGILHLTHVQSGRRVRTNDADGRVYVDDKHDGDPSRDYAFTFVDWDSLVRIPKRVAFKGDNGKYLQAVWYGTPWNWTYGYPNQQFSSSDGNHEYAAYEVHLHPDGHLRIKSEHLGRFWRRSPNWIWGDSTDDSGTDVDTLFWPVKIDSRTIALRNAGNNQFCKRLTADNKESCLNAAVSSITTEAKLVVEELVLERSIYNVRYRMEDARVFDEQPFLVGIGTASNESDMESSLTIKVAYEDTRSYSFTNTLSIKSGVKTTIQTGFPHIVGGQIEISAEVTNSFEWRRTTEEKKIAEATFTVKVPARSRVRVNCVGTHGKCSVPFSYIQRDMSSSDGRLITSDHIDGIFNGVNYYSFRFEQLIIEPLSSTPHAIVVPPRPNLLSSNLLLVLFFLCFNLSLFGFHGEGFLSSTLSKLVFSLIVIIMIKKFYD